MALAKTSLAVIARGTPSPAFTSLTGCSATRSGTTATLSKTAHGLSNGNAVLVQGFYPEEFNGVFTVSNSSSNAFDYTIKQDPGANPSGTPGTVDKVVLGTALDLRAKYGASVVGGLQNGTSGPTLAPQIWLGVSASSNEADYVWRLINTGDTVANAYTAFAMSFGTAVAYVNFAVCRNTAQPVDCHIQATTVDSL